MKKLMTAMAVCAVASLSMADGTTVTSGNVVGYRHESDPNGAWIQQIHFAQVGATNYQTCSLSNVLDYTTLATYDQLWVFDVNLGDYVQYAIGADLLWHDVLTGLAKDIVVQPGNAALIISGNTLTFSGQVPSLTSYTHQFDGSGAYLMGSAIPRDATISSFDWVDALSLYDQLWIFDVNLGDYVQYAWSPTSGGTGAPAWFNVLTGIQLPNNTLLNRGFLLITGATSLTENL